MTTEKCLYIHTYRQFVCFIYIYIYLCGTYMIVFRLWSRHGFIHVYKNIYIHIHVYISIHVYVYIYIYMYMYTYIYTYIYLLCNRCVTVVQPWSKTLPWICILRTPNSPYLRDAMSLYVCRYVCMYVCMCMHVC